MADTHRSETILPTGLRVLLEDIIDYAGMFPPASLSLDEAIKNFAQYRTSQAAWLLGRFVVPASSLSELDAHAALFESDSPIRFSVLAGCGSDASTFIEQLESELGSVAAFRRRHTEGVSIDAFEMRTPEVLLTTDVVSVARFLTDVDAVLERHALQSADLFFEIPLDQNCRQTAPIMVGALHSFNRDRTVDERGRAGLKMRMGGTEADAFPSVDSIAFGIAACRDAGVPFKATAGLHHPVRHYSDEVDATMHGFLNVFVAAVLASAEDATEAELASILMEENARAFAFNDDGFEWNGYRTGADVIARARRDLAVSFGSCSFAEPVEDLRSIGLL